MRVYVCAYEHTHTHTHTHTQEGQGRREEGLGRDARRRAVEIKLEGRTADEWWGYADYKVVTGVVEGLVQCVFISLR